MGETEIPKGSYAAGRRVKLPTGAEAAVCRLHQRGPNRARTSSFNVRAGEIVFTRQLVKEEVGAGRWLAMYLGLFGTYRKDETVDLQFHRARQGRAMPPPDLPSSRRLSSSALGPAPASRYLKT